MVDKYHRSCYSFRVLLPCWGEEHGSKFFLGGFIPQSYTHRPKADCPRRGQTNAEISGMVGIDDRGTLARYVAPYARKLFGCGTDRPLGCDPDGGSGHHQARHPLHAGWLLGIRHYWRSQHPWGTQTGWKKGVARVL